MNYIKDDSKLPEHMKETFDTMCKEQYKTLLTDLMAENTVTVFSNSFCPYCPKAKDLLKRNRVGHTEVILDQLNPND